MAGLEYLHLITYDLKLADSLWWDLIQHFVCSLFRLLSRRSWSSIAARSRIVTVEPYFTGTGPDFRLTLTALLSAHTYSDYCSLLTRTVITVHCQYSSFSNALPNHHTGGQ